MKKILLSILAIIFCIPAFILAGCGNKPNYIDMDTYFNSEVKYYVHSQGEGKTTLNKLTSSSHSDLNKYTSIFKNNAIMDKKEAPKALFCPLFIATF